MNNYLTVELSNNSKYIVVEILNLNEKIYFLLTKILDDGKNISDIFDIVLFNIMENSFESLIDEDEYLYVKNMFENKLDIDRNNNDKLGFNNIHKYKIVDRDNLLFVLKNDSDEFFNLEMELYGNFDIKVNDYIYISDNLLKENDIVRFGSVYTDKTEIIKVVSENKVFYLQRYYG